VSIDEVNIGVGLYPDINQPECGVFYCTVSPLYPLAFSVLAKTVSKPFLDLLNNKRVNVV
jgi:hypothetical protein